MMKFYCIRKFRAGLKCRPNSSKIFGFGFSVTLAFLLLGFSTPGFSQTKLEKIASILALNKDVTKSIITTMADAMGDTKDAPQEVKDSIKGWMIMVSEAIHERTIMFYDSIFTESEVDEIISFYKSGAGEKMVNLSPELGNLGERVTAEWKAANEGRIKEWLGSKRNDVRAFYKPDEIFPKMTPYEVQSSEKSKARFHSTAYPYYIKYDEDKWRPIDCADLNPVANGCFESMEDDIFAMVIAEKAELDLRKLKAVALFNLHQAPGEADINEIGLLNLNGHEVLTMQMSSEVEGQIHVYDNYYFADDRMAIQLLVFCEAALHQKNLGLIQAFKNGLHIE